MISVKKLASGNYQGVVATRDNIYAGKLIAPINPEIEPVIKYYDELDNELSGDELIVKGRINKVVTGGEIYRKMLFALNEYDLSEDLLYNSPNYYVRGIEPKIKVDKDIMIGEYYKLEELLIYFKYNKDLTNNDIKRIYRLFLKNDRFLNAYAEVFGLTTSKIFGKRENSSTDKKYPFSPILLENLSKLTTYKIYPPDEEKQKVLRRQNSWQLIINKI